MKYFHRSLLHPQPRGRQIVASFYYSYREGERQTNHSNMLRSVLYDVLNQNEEYFFHFQSSYRQAAQGSAHPEWSYKSLRGILLSLVRDHPVSEHLYLIVDAMDESDDGKRIDVINFLHELCATNGRCVVKIFVASRPVPGLSGHSARSDKMIRLQDVNYSDILRFAESFLDSPELGLPHGIAHSARGYIARNAQGVFVWVYLVREELLEYARDGNYTERQIFDFLKSLPTELEGIYQRILMRLERGKEQNIEVGRQMLQFVLFVYRPLGIGELRQALAIQGNLDSEHSCSDESFEKDLIYGIERSIISCSGNLLEITAWGGHGSSFSQPTPLGQFSLADKSAGNGIVQVMHQTVREFFRPEGSTAGSKFQMNSKDTHMRITIACVRYLILCATKMATIAQEAGSKPWTSEHFESYAQYLHERPFFNYAIEYLERHLQQCGQVAGDSELISQLNEKLKATPAAYLLENWIPRAWGKRTPGHKEDRLAFREGLLHAATHMKFPKVVEALLLAGAEINTRRNSKTLLMMSAKSGDLATALVLLDRGVDVGAKDFTGQTALHFAAANGHDPVVGLLVERGADMEARNFRSETAMHLGAANGHSPVVKILIDQGAEKEAEDNENQTALRLAAANGQSPVVGHLIDSGADKEAKDSKGRTALHLAASNGHAPAAGLLMDRGAEKEAKDYQKQTALHLAAENGKSSVAGLLIDCGADMEAKDREERTALHLAAANGHNPTITLLVDRGANKDAKDALGWRMLHMAAWGGQEATIQMLVQRLDAEMEERDKCGWTAFHVAAMNGCDAMSRYLVEHLNADKEAKDVLGWTALHFVAALGFEDTAELLIETIGMNRDARTDRLETAKDLACK